MDEVKRPFGASVRAWRHRLGISQEELAARAGLHRTYVCDVERGTRNVSLESIEKLARALEISITTLFSYGAAPASERQERIAAKEMIDILYVEDTPEDVEMAMQTLKDAGIANRIRVARDGAEALHLLLGEEKPSAPATPGQIAARTDRYVPQVILLDLSLPKINGLEVLRRIKSHPRTASIPVVVLTASSREFDWQASKRLGAAAYIVKPLNFENLTRVTPSLSMQWALLSPAVVA
jgi:two-component system response regulator